MVQTFISLLFTSLAGITLTVLLILIRPLTEKIFSAHWHYYMWLAVLIIMILPVKIDLPAEDVSVALTEPAVSVNTGDFVQAKTVENTKEEADFHIFVKETGVAVRNYLPQTALIWAIIALILILRKIFGYGLFIHSLKKNSCVIPCPEINMFTKRKVQVRATESITSPMLTGIFKPVLLLPAGEITNSQLLNILSHETTHLKRNDILYKWFAGAVKCIHWYNPAVYFICREMDIDCEISCDMSVIRNMKSNEKAEYIETVLSLIKTSKTKSSPLTTTMAGKKSILKKRFGYIKKGKRTGKAANIISAITATVIFLTSLFASGVLSAEFSGDIPDSSVPEPEITDKGKFIDLSGKVLYKNGEFYLPFEELLEKTELLTDENSYYKKEGNRITICITEKSTASDYSTDSVQTGGKIRRLLYYYGLETGKNYYIINPEGTLPPERAHLSQKVKTNNAPFESEGTLYVPYEYIKLMINKVMQTHEITLWDVASVNKLTDKNCEELSYRDIQRLQNAVNRGEYQWRIDYKEVIINFLSKLGYNAIEGKVLSFSGDNDECTVVFTFDNLVFEFRLTKPLDKTDTGIWVISSYSEKKNSRVGEVELRDKNGAALEVADKGYGIDQNSVAHVSLNAEVPDFHGEVPESVTAYYTPDNGESYEIGKSEGPFKEIPIEVPLSPPKEGNSGSLQFGLEYENSSEALSESYDVYRKIKSDDKKEYIEGTDILLSFCALNLEDASIGEIEDILKESGTTVSKDAKNDLSKNYLIGACEIKDDIKTMCDENGNITFYFGEDSDDYVDVTFSESESGKLIGSYGIMPDKSMAYSFIGFDKDKEYSVEMQAQTNEKLNYLIY